MIKVGIVDDHAIVRTGLRQFFSEQVDLRVVGEAGSGREAIILSAPPSLTFWSWTFPCPDKAASMHWP